MVLQLFVVGCTIHFNSLHKSEVLLLAPSARVFALTSCLSVLERVVFVRRDCKSHLYGSLLIENDSLRLLGRSVTQHTRALGIRIHLKRGLIRD